MHLKEDIKDEEKGEKRYKALAKKDAKNKALYKKMAKDEERHHESLEKIESAEHSAKGKALKKKC